MLMVVRNILRATALELLCFELGELPWKGIALLGNSDVEESYVLFLNPFVMEITLLSGLGSFRLL